MLASYVLTVAGAGSVLVATLIGGFGAAWTFLPPLAFYPAGQWPVWSESLFFVGMLLVGSGFFVYCIDVLKQTTSTYGGLSGALGWRFLRGHEPEAPPASVIAATVVAFDGLLAMSAGMTMGLGLLGRTYDSTSASTCWSRRTSSTSSGTRSPTCSSTSPPVPSMCCCPATRAVPTR